MNRYRILLSCESSALCQGLAITFEENSQFNIIDNVSSDLLLETALRMQPDILIWKIDTDDYKPRLAEINHQCPFTLIIILVEDPSNMDIRDLIKCGVRACLPLRLFPRQIVYAIELTAEAGIMCLPRPNIKDLQNDLTEVNIPIIDALSNREREVLKILLNGSANQEIAACLCLAESTVKTHLHNIYQKMGVHNRHEAYLKLVNMRPRQEKSLF